MEKELIGMGVFILIAALDVWLVYKHLKSNRPSLWDLSVPGIVPDWFMKDE